MTAKPRFHYFGNSKPLEPSPNNQKKAFIKASITVDSHVLIIEPSDENDRQPTTTNHLISIRAAANHTFRPRQLCILEANVCDHNRR